jgi:hypothetical protein
MADYERKSWRSSRGTLILLVAGLGLVALFATAVVTRPGTVLGTALLFGTLAFLGALLGDRERRWVRTETYRVDPISGQRTLTHTTPWRYLGEFFLTGPVGAAIGGAVFGLVVGTGIALLRPLFSGPGSEAAARKITSLAFSPDGRTLAVALDGSGVELRSVVTGAVGTTLPHGALAVTYAGTGRAIAVAAEQGISVYDPASLDTLASLETSPPLGMALDSEVTSLVTVHRDCGTSVWSLTAGGAPTRFANHAGEPHTDVEGAVSPRGRFVAARAQPDLVVRRVTDGAEVGRHATVAFRADTWGVAPNGLAISDDGSRLASGDGNIIRIWGTDSLVLPGHEGWVSALAMDSAGTMLASAGDDHRIRLWNLRTGEAIAVLGTWRTGHDLPVMKVAISPDGSRIASAAAGGMILLWDVVGRKVLWSAGGKP